jgi:transposase
MSEVNDELLAVGIDVSKASLEVALMYSSKEISGSYPNDEAGLAELAERLRQSTGTYKVVMESTGRYHLLAALRLAEAGIDVRVINPLLAKRYYRSQIRKIKTDKADARVLAQVALLEKNLPKSFGQDKTALQIRQKMGLLASLEKQLQALKAILNDYQAFQQQLGIEASELEQQVVQSIKTFSQHINKLELELQQLVLTQSQHSATVKRLQSIPGISKPLAALITQFLDSTSQHPKQWIAFLGLDIAVRESGQWKGKGKVTKRGNAYLRKRLYNAAWGATMNDKDFRSYYDSLKRQGSSHVEALLIIARKLLRIAFTVVTQNVSYDPKCAFPA